MSTGLIALLDDVAAIAKVAAASIDDVAGQAAQAGVKAAGVVIDDTAVTPRYVVGFSPDRELPIVGKIALGSLRNKMLILLPAALALSLVAPWAITPLLMIGGLFLCFEGAEKVYEMVVPHGDHGHGAADAESAAALEDAKVTGAIRTDFILSAEIMALTLATVAASSLVTQALVLALVGVGITAGVYGAVALIVKADDIGLGMARNKNGSIFGGATRAIGRGIVRGMPPFLQVLSAIGTAAMIWVGGGIVIHGLETYGLPALGHIIHDLSDHAAAAAPLAGGFIGWLVSAGLSGIVGLVIGLVLIPIVTAVIAPAWSVVSRLWKRKH